MPTVPGHVILQSTNVIGENQFLVRHGGHLGQFLNEFLQGGLSFFVLGGLRLRHSLLQHFLFHYPLMSMRNHRGVTFNHHHMIFREGVQSNGDQLFNGTHEYQLFNRTHGCRWGNHDFLLLTLLLFLPAMVRAFGWTTVFPLAIKIWITSWRDIAILKGSGHPLHKTKCYGHLQKTKCDNPEPARLFISRFSPSSDWFILVSRDAQIRANVPRLIRWGFSFSLASRDAQIRLTAF